MGRCSLGFCFKLKKAASGCSPKIKKGCKVLTAALEILISKSDHCLTSGTARLAAAAAAQYAKESVSV